MMDSLLRALERRDPRLPKVIAAMLIVFLVIEAWMFLLRKPFTEYQRLQGVAQNLAMSVSARGGPSTEIELVEREIKGLSTRLSGELQLVQTGDRVVPPLIETLDHSAQANGLQLASVRPGGRRTVSGFDERSFEVSVTGAYLPLAGWMLGFGDKLGQNVSITDIEMRPAGTPGKLNLNMRIAVYLPLAGGGVP